LFKQCMRNKYLKVSVTMAFMLGIALPLAETIRRIRQILAVKNIFHWLDDYFLGAVLLLAAFRVKTAKPKSTEFLIASWGVAAGAVALSLLGHLDHYYRRLPDPGIFNSDLVIIAKAVILIFILVGLYYSIKATGN
jgi:hypothetical protein